MSLRRGAATASTRFAGIRRAGVCGRGRGDGVPASPVFEIRHKKRSQVLLRLECDSLVGANLRGAKLRHADLTGADLGNADLRGADLRGAVLRGADLRVADLRGANLRGADLRRASLRFARYDRRTRWPWFFDPRAALG